MTDAAKPHPVPQNPPGYDVLKDTMAVFRQLCPAGTLAAPRDHIKEGE